MQWNLELGLTSKCQNDRLGKSRIGQTTTLEFVALRSANAAFFREVKGDTY